MKGERCKHDMPPGQCAWCHPIPKARSAGPPVPATALLHCQECHAQLGELNARKTSLGRVVTKLREDHSRPTHPEMGNPPYAPGEIELRCDECRVEIGRLDAGTKTLGGVVMSYLSDHKREKHT